MLIQPVTPATAAQWHREGSAVFIDVREPAEFSSRHIKGALLKPVGNISVEDLPRTNKKIVLYCQKGVRGQTACTKVTSGEDDITVFNLTGGIAAWQADDLLETGEASILPLDRQVQITIGAGVLLSSLAAYFFHPAYVGIAGFFGAGLLFAGVSGTCGLAVLLAKMPWNQKIGQGAKH
ncbi:rhodanese-like domain-containing protein [Alteromonas oceanisediminis]|uniref:rhodanese-like domain-containing protein n=1 Tax=Alteromonas oceanisediminis TaxID=2836180 RepID=UPI001BD99E28|nr:rhodanese-like domain-containing protein [Alteromonas oceanisediminis]MBT0585572.1 rhodanese-like domain-containing protein [Alteromonas oceanisediminis]